MRKKAKCIRCGVELGVTDYQFYIQKTLGTYSDDDEGPICELCFPVSDTSGLIDIKNPQSSPTIRGINMNDQELLDGLREFFDELMEKRDRLQKEKEVIQNQLNVIRPVLSGSFKLINYLVEFQSSTPTAKEVEK